MQWAESLFKELDYRREARNGIRFKELYGDLEVCAYTLQPAVMAWLALAWQPHIFPRAVPVEDCRS